MGASFRVVPTDALGHDIARRLCRWRALLLAREHCAAVRHLTSRVMVSSCECVITGVW